MVERTSSKVIPKTNSLVGVDEAREEEILKAAPSMIPNDPWTSTSLIIPFSIVVVSKIQLQMTLRKRDKIITLIWVNSQDENNTILIKGQITRILRKRFAARRMEELE